jgi:hypothetical protein
MALDIPLPTASPQDDPEQYVPLLLSAIEGFLLARDVWEVNDYPEAYSYMQELMEYIVGVMENPVIYPTTFNINPLTALLIAGGALSRIVSTSQLYDIVVEVTPAAINNQMEFDFYCAEGNYDLKIMGGRGTNYGIVAPGVDGVFFATGQSWYNAGNANNIEYTYNGDIVGDGNHTLQILTTAKHASSSGYRFFLSSITGKRTGDLP